MSNRAWIAAGVIAMFIGCRTTGHPEPSRTEARSSPEVGAATGSPPPRDGDFVAVSHNPATDELVCPPGTEKECTDPLKCTCGNGTGVYAAEGGFAGFKVRMERGGFTEQMIMITQFINNPLDPNGANVTFAYGYYFQLNDQWQWKSLGIGHVDSADYAQPNQVPQTKLKVSSVSEIGTLPAWRLLTPGGDTRLVDGDNLIGLKLNISLTIPGYSVKNVILSFSATGTNKVPPPGGNILQTVNEYRMLWENPSDYNDPPQQYCHGSTDQPDDMAVFQQGIDVDPLTGTVKHPNASLKPNPADVVTVSCSLGAPAMVYSWGYPYKGLDTDAATFYFDAGIHMKRASYCGDARYYTWAATQINISDNRLIHKVPVLPPFNPPGIEAWWGRNGAVCVNSENMRHVSMAPKNVELLSCGSYPYSSYKGQVAQLPSCFFACNGQLLPRCPPNPQKPPRSQFLVDGAAGPNQP